MHKGFVSEYEDVASTLAAVAVGSGSNSLIDRLASALSSDTVHRVVYEMSRMLDSISAGTGDTRIEQRGSEIRIENKKEEPKIYTITGSLAAPDHIQRFLDEAGRNTQVARSVASYAIYLVARSKAGVEQR